nr:hypothetical protein KitaXyl93_20280 [Kitasatospora sp. Xyl93]
MPHLNDRSPIVRIEVVDHLPNGRLVARLEAPHCTTFVVNGEGLPEEVKPYFEEMEGLMREAVESALWNRNPLPPPPGDSGDPEPGEGEE